MTRLTPGILRLPHTGTSSVTRLTTNTPELPLFRALYPFSIPSNSPPPRSFYVLFLGPLPLTAYLFPFLTKSIPTSTNPATNSDNWIIQCLATSKERNNPLRFKPGYRRCTTPCQRGFRLNFFSHAWSSGQINGRPASPPVLIRALDGRIGANLLGEQASTYPPPTESVQKCCWYPSGWYTMTAALFVAELIVAPWLARSS